MHQILDRLIPFISSLDKKMIRALMGYNSLEFINIITFSFEDNPANQYNSPSPSCAMDELSMYNWMYALFVYDDIPKHSIAYRQICLKLKRPSGREAYSSVFFISIQNYLNLRHILIQTLAMALERHYRL
jgi:F0F1-type ATP synthase alpha subunit